MNSGFLSKYIKQFLYLGILVVCMIPSTVRADETIALSDRPHTSIIVGTKLYVLHAQLDSTTVSIISTTNNTIVDSISVGFPSVFVTLSGTKLYLLNSNNDSVSVVDTTTDTVSSTITVGDRPIYSTAVGDKVYVVNTDSNTVSVIDTVSDTVVATIPTGGDPYGTAVVGQKIICRQ